MSTMVDANASPPMASKKMPASKVITPSSGMDHTLPKRMTVERGVVDELLLVCGVIGTTTDDGDKLVPVTDCLNWLQDLQRALRRDDDTFRPISLLLAKWKVVQQKLLPLVMTCRYDTSMVLTIVKILVILTKPLGEAAKRAGRFAIDTKKFSEESIKEQNKLRDNALAQSEMLMEFKKAVTHYRGASSSKKTNQGEQEGGLLSVFVSLLAEPISKTGSARSDVDHLTIELVLHLFRNLLAAEPLLKTSSDVSQGSLQLHQELVCLCESELVLEILLVVAQDMESRENQNYNLLLMELLNLLLKSQDPTSVARSIKVKPTTTKATSFAKENPRGSSLLRSQLQKEKQKYRGLTTSRHSHFGGTLVVNRPDGKRQYVSAALMDKSAQPPGAKKRRNRKREAFVGSNNSTRTTTNPTALRAQQTIHKFCERFVADCYGPLMKSLKNEFRRDSVRLEEGDTVVFFRIVWFFAQWARVCRKEGLGHLIFTMDVFTFKLVLGAMDTYMQHKKYPQLAQTTALYGEMMHMLHNMYNSTDSTENIMSLGLMDTLFYGQEPLDRLPKLLSKWQPGTSTREHLCDIAEIVHMTLKMLELIQTACLKDDDVGDLNALKKKDKKAAEKRDAVARMKACAADFDVTSYILRKVVSNQVVSMYTHLLSQYAVNAPHVNHRIMAFLMRLQKIQIAVSEDHEEEGQSNQLATKTVTLEPMLYNINMIMVLNEILNDSSIRKEKDFVHLLTFATRVMCGFAEATKDNPLLVVESLFRHPVPHRFCEYTTNHYVNEELRMIAERELLMEEQQRMMEAEKLDEEEDDLEVSAPSDAPGASLEPRKAALPASKKAEDSDDDDEIEWDDAGKVSESTPSDGKSKRKDVILSDSDSDDDNEPPRKRNVPSKEGGAGSDTSRTEQPVAKKKTRKEMLWDSDSDDSSTAEEETKESESKEVSAEKEEIADTSSTQGQPVVDDTNKRKAAFLSDGDSSDDEADSDTKANPATKPEDSLPDTTNEAPSNQNVDDTDGLSKTNQDDGTEKDTRPVSSADKDDASPKRRRDETITEQTDESDGPVDGEEVSEPTAKKVRKELDTSSDTESAEQSGPEQEMPCDDQDADGE